MYYLTIKEYLKSPGGQVNMAINGSTTPTTYSYTVENDSAIALENIRVILRDNSPSFTADNFGQISALTNGLRFYIDDGTTVTYLHSDKIIKTNLDILEVFACQNSIDVLETGNLLACWNMKKEEFLKNGWKIGVLIEDNLSTLDDLHVQIEIKKYH
jgi:hypothetical protein